MTESEALPPRKRPQTKRQSVIEKRKKQLRRVRRDTLIVTFALTMGAFEIVFGGARASVFTFLGGLLISPIVLRYDEARKEANDD